MREVWLKIQVDLGIDPVYGKVRGKLINPKLAVWSQLLS